jgi:hypothetical protein
VPSLTTRCRTHNDTYSTLRRKEKAQAAEAGAEVEAEAQWQCHSEHRCNPRRTCSADCSDRTPPSIGRVHSTMTSARMSNRDSSGRRCCSSLSTFVVVTGVA